MTGAACRRLASGWRLALLHGIALLQVVACVLACGIAGAQSPEAARYRRILVPEDALESQIRGLLPMNREDFERRTSDRNRPAELTAGPAAARIESAKFAARLNGGQLEGTAELTIVSPSDQPTLLSLAPCNVAICSPTWGDSERRPAVLGNDPQGVLQCVVNGSGILRGNWSARADQTQLRRAEFTLRLPAAPRRVLEIEAPSDLELSIDQGLCKAAAASEPGLRRWTAELNGHAELRLTAARGDSAVNESALLIAKETSDYTVLPAGIELDAAIALDIPREQIDRLDLNLDAGLTATAIEFDGQALAFTALESPSGASVVSLELPSNVTGFNHSLRVSATADSPQAGPWKLPRATVASSALQEGRITISSPAWLKLQARPAGGCQLTSVTAATAGRPSDEFRFQLFRPEAEIELTADYSLPGLQEQSGVHFSVEGNQVKGVLIADLSTIQGERFAIEALIARQWIVDGIEANPPEALADRTVLPSSAGQQLLRLNLTRPVNPARHLQLIIRAHTRRPPNGRSIPEGFFSLANFSDVGNFRRLVHLQIDEPGSEFTLAGEGGLQQRDPKDLTAGDLRLFESPPGGLVVEINDAEQAIRGTLTQATARYRADVLVRAEAAAARLQQTVSIRCQPDSSAVNSLLVRLAPRPLEKVAWRIEGGQPGDVAATLLGSDGASAPGIDGSQRRATTDGLALEPEAALYRLTLPRARSASFEIVGQWSAPQSSQQALTLAWLPEASIQTGIVEFHVTGDDQFVLSADEAEALPSARPSRDQPASLHARYRYDASQRAHIRIQPAPAAAVQRGAWIDQLHLTSYFTADGRSEHEAALAVRNAGLAKFSIRFREPVRDPRLVDSQGQETPLVQSAAGELSVPLDSDLPLTRLRVRYSTVANVKPSGFHGALVAPIPEPDLPVLMRRWSVGLPPGWSALGRPATAQSQPPDAGEKRTALASLVSAIRGPAWGWKWLLLEEQTPVAPGDSPFAGWRVVERELPRAPAAAIGVYQPRMAMIGALCAALAAAALSPWLLKRALWLLPAGGLLVATGLLAPPPVAWLCVGILAGLAVGSALARRRFQRQASDRRADSNLLAGAKLHPGAAAILLVISAGSIATLPSPRRALAAQDERLPRVVIPVDDERQPVGDYVYVEPSLYETLHRQATSGRIARPAWLLEQVRYEFPGAVRSDGPAPAVDRFSVTCDLHTFAAGAVFRLPFRREQILLLESAARLDGQPAATAWQADGAALEITIPMPGEHRLELSLGAIARRAGRDILLELAVPPAAELRVTIPPGGAQISGCPAFLSLDSLPAEQPVPATAEALSIRWPLADQATSESGGVLADQYLWWKVRPGSVVLEAKFRVQSIGGPIQHVAIAADPRLRLLPVASAAGRVTAHEGPQHMVNVEFSEPQEGPIPLRLSWLWPDVTGPGELRFPGVQIQADRLNNQWQAISAGDGLEVSAFPKLPAISTAEFVQAWGEADIAAPAVALDVSGAVQEEPVVIRPEDRPPRAEHSVDWSLNGTSATAHINVRLSEVPESRFDYRLPLPPQLKVATARLMHGGRPVNIRWLQQVDGLLCLQLLELPAAQQELSVIAELPLPRMRSRVPLAAPRLRDVALESSTMRIFRQADVGLRLESPAGWTPLNDGQAGQHEAERGRLVASLRNEAAIGDTQPIVSRSANRPEIKGFAFIRAHEADGDWRGEVDLALDVTGGVQDELQLVIPDRWAGPLEFEPPMAHRIEELPGPRKRLTIVPPQAISGAFAVSIRGSLHSGETGLAAPDVALVNMPTVERIVLLDRGQGGQRIVWETTGLMPANPSQVAMPDRWRSASGDLLRVVGPRFDATARLHQETTAAPVVRLADLRFAIASGGRMAGIGRYTIRPAGARGINLVLPPDCRLVQALIDGVATTATRQGPRNWELATPSSVLPFELVLVFDGALARGAAANDEVHLTAPRLPGMRVEQTVWEITTPDQPARLASGEEAVEACSARAAAVRRLEAAARGLDDVANAQAADVLAPILAEAAVHWNIIYARYSRQLAGIEPAAEEADSAVSRRVQAAEGLAARARQRLAVLNMLAPDAAASERQVADKDSSTPLFLAADNEVSQLKVNAAAAGNRSLASRLWAVLAISLATIAVPLARWPQAQQWFAAHAHLLLALAGLAWWLFGPLGWLGWLAVFAAIWLSVRFS